MGRWADGQMGRKMSRHLIRKATGAAKYANYNRLTRIGINRINAIF